MSICHLWNHVDKSTAFLHLLHQQISQQSFFFESILLYFKLLDLGLLGENQAKIKSQNHNKQTYKRTNKQKNKQNKTKSENKIKIRFGRFSSIQVNFTKSKILKHCFWMIAVYLHSQQCIYDFMNQLYYLILSVTFILLCFSKEGMPKENGKPVL